MRIRSCMSRFMPGSRRVGCLMVPIWMSMMAAPAEAAQSHDMHMMVTWSSNPRVWIGLTIGLVMYVIGIGRLWMHSGVGKGISLRQAGAFFAGWIVLVLALLSPLDAISGMLFSVHMVQHLLLILVAAPLVVLGAPLFAALWALPRTARKYVGNRLGRDSAWRASWDVVSQPLLVWTAFFATLWLWHIPGLYDAALRSQLVHDVQHLGFMTAACMTWWILLNPMGRLKLNRGSGVLYLFTTSLHAAALGVLLTFSPVAWYDYYRASTAAWGLSWIEDQQLGGVIMWMPAGFVYIVLAGAIFSLWLRDSERADRRIERFARLHLHKDQVDVRNRLWDLSDDSQEVIRPE